MRISDWSSDVCSSDLDVVYDSVGKTTLDGSFRALARRGVLVNYGNSSGAVKAIDPLEVAEAGSVYYTRPHQADYMTTNAERQSRADDLFEMVNRKSTRLNSSH